MLALLLLPFALAIPTRRAINPVVKNATLYGPISETLPQYLDRDSCGSTRWNNRALLVCRDTEIYKDLANRTEGIDAFFGSSASYIDFNADGSLPFVPFTPEPGTPASETDFPYRLPCYGQNNNLSFYQTTPDECDYNTGACENNNTRWAIWPDSPPMVSTNDGGSITAYTWVKKSYITDSLGVVIENPATSLYRVNSVASENDVLPTVTLVNENFFQVDQWPYGAYGNIVVDGVAYLFAALGNGTQSLARVPIGSEENLSAYEYYVGGQWTSTMPSFDDPAAAIAAGAGGQGTFYWSEPWQSFVWIGQDANDGTLAFRITVAPEITGPWTEPVVFFSNSSQPGLAYSVQAHPAFLSDPCENSVWVSYTQNVQNYGYDTILYKFDWE